MPLDLRSMEAYYSHDENRVMMAQYRAGRCFGKVEQRQEPSRRLSGKSGSFRESCFQFAARHPRQIKVNQAY